MGGAAESNKFSAPGPALGYIAQVDYALLLSLRRLELSDGDLSLETLDDVVFHQTTTSPEELLQTKHHVDRSATLSDSSVDLWKTLSNWIVGASATAWLGLLTTSTSAPGSAASYLGVQPEKRDHLAALRSLERTARESLNAGNTTYYQRFLALEADARLSLLQRVTVFDAAPAAVELASEIQNALRKAVPARQRLALAERLCGWWHHRVVNHLTEVASGVRSRISLGEIENQIHVISRSLRDDDLPIDFDGIDEPGLQAASSDARVFVQQLRLISLGNSRLRQCIYDHNRAYAQRSRWQREKLLNVGELESYDRQLVDEWRRHFTPLTDETFEDQYEQTTKAEARQRFHTLDTSQLPPIRSGVSARFVANGSLHVLADRMEIGWHPDWVERLRHLLPEIPGAHGALVVA